MTAMGQGSELYARGMRHLETLDPEAEAMLRKQLDDLAPEMVEYTVAFGYGEVYDVERLDARTRQVATVAALTALGNAAPQLRFHINASLNLGMRPREIVEIIYVTVVFAGFPAGLNAMAVARDVFTARGQSVEPAATPEGARRERGVDALRATSGASGELVLDALREMSPELADFILDFSYGDVISRQEIPPRWKEIAMVAAATARGTMQPQLAVHLRAALNVGCSQQELKEVLVQMTAYVGFPAALNALAVLKRVREERKD